MVLWMAIFLLIPLYFTSIFVILNNKRRYYIYTAVSKYVDVFRRGLAPLFSYILNTMKTSQKIYLPFKRLIGIFDSLIGIIVCFIFLWWWVIPVNAIVARERLFFVHERYGKNKNIFKMIKFRLMRLDVNPNLAPSDMDVQTQANMNTGFGEFLKKTSIDETLQLLNIFVDQMAFIGPRPGSAHNEEYLRECRERCTPNAYDVKLGNSGSAQIKMRRERDPEFKAEWAHIYVERMSLWFDTKFFFYTILKLFGAVKGR